MGWPGPLTHRQFTAWCAWRALDMNLPRREDAYAMQTAAEVRRVLRKDQASVKLEHMLLKFEDGQKPVTVDPQRQSEVALRRVIGVRGGFSPKQLKAILEHERAVAANRGERHGDDHRT